MAGLCSNCGGIEVYYDSQSVIPTPVITKFDRVYNRTEANEAIGTVYNIELSGWVLVDDGPTNLESVLVKKTVLTQIFSCDFKQLEIWCSDTLMFSSCVKIIDISFGKAGDNWAQKIPYTITLRANSTSSSDTCYPGCLNSINESWNIEQDPEINHYIQVYDFSATDGRSCQTGADSGIDAWTRTGVLQETGYEPPYSWIVTRELSAQAENCCTGFDATGGLIDTGVNPFFTGESTPGWQVARDWVESKLYSSPPATGVFDNFLISASADRTGYFAYDYARTTRYSQTDGSFSATETWRILNDRSASVFTKAAEDFSMEVRESENEGFKTVSLQGTIQGYQDVEYTNGTEFKVVQSKYDNALEYYKYIEPRLLVRAEYAVNDLPESETNVLRINERVKDKSVVFSPRAGTVSYNVTYDTKCCDLILLTTGIQCTILKEDINISEERPIDIYAEISILGKPCPIFQNLNMKTKGRKDVSVNLVIDTNDQCFNSITNYLCPPCKHNVDQMMNEVFLSLSGTYGAIITSKDIEQWDPKSGLYSRNVSFDYTCCTGYVFNC